MSHLQASVNLHRFQLFVLPPLFADIVAVAAIEAALKQSLQGSLRKPPQSSVRLT